jgi:protein SCO1/2
MNRNIRILLVCAIAVIGIGTAGLVVLLLFPAATPKIASSLAGAIGGPFTLTATDGRTVTDQTYRGKWLLLYFGYTSCPDACPTALNNMGVALDRLGPEAAALQPISLRWTRSAIPGKRSPNTSHPSIRISSR